MVANADARLLAGSPNCTSMKLRRWARRARFFILERLLLPVAIVPLKLLVWSWRRRGPDEATVRDALATRPLILATYHGMFLHLLAYAHLSAPSGRPLVALITPSLDGQLLGAALRYFGIEHVMAQPGKRAVAAAREFQRRLQQGWIGVIAVDGPRGPVGMAQPYAIQLAQSCDAAIFIAVTSTSRGISAGSWDRSRIPLPFATVEFRLHRFFPTSPEPQALSNAALQEALWQGAREIGSPVTSGTS